MTYEEVFEWIDDNYDIDDYDSSEEMYYAIESDWTGRNDFASVISLDDFNSRYFKGNDDDEFISNGGSQRTGDSPTNIEEEPRSTKQNLSGWQKISKGVKGFLRF